MTIDWNDLRRGYNDRYSETHPSIRCFLSAAYREFGSAAPLADVLGVGYTTLLKAMRRYNVPRKQGGPPKSEMTKRYLSTPPRKYTAAQLAKILGCTPQNIYALSKKYGRRYRPVQHRLPEG